MGNRLADWGVEGADRTALERNAAAKRLGSRNQRLEDLSELTVMTGSFKHLEVTALEEARRAATARVANERWRLTEKFMRKLNEGYLLADIINASGLSAPTVYRYLDEYVDMHGGTDRYRAEVEKVKERANWRVLELDEVQGLIRVQKRGDETVWYMDTRDPKKGAEIFGRDNGVSMSEQRGNFPDDARDLIEHVKTLYRAREASE